MDESATPTGTAMNRWDEAALRLHSPGLSTSQIIRLLEEIVAELGLGADPRVIPVVADPLEEQERHRIVVAVRSPGEPLLGGSRIHGYLVATGPEDSRRPIELLAAHAGVALTAAVQVTEISQREEAARRVAERLQDAMLPEVPPVANTLLAVRYRAAGKEAQVGGDFYDVFPLPDGRVLILVGDVMGKGVEAAGRMSVVAQTIRTLALQDLALERLLERVDEQMRFQDPDMMATVWCGLYEPTSGELEFASLGHPPALLLRAEGEPMYLTLQGLPVGMRDLTEEAPELRSRQLAPRDLLVLYTDGVVEASGDLVAGQESLLAAISARRDQPLDELADGALDELLAHTGYLDDALMLLVRRR